jgi:hypothetical protein
VFTRKKKKERGFRIYKAGFLHGLRLMVDHLCDEPRGPCPRRADCPWHDFVGDFLARLEREIEENEG